MDVRPRAHWIVSGTDPALSLQGITKRFGNTVALDGAHISVRSGSLHALLGENGAGKTTLMRLAFGMLRADGGVVETRGVPRHWRSNADAIADGMGMVHQHFLLVSAMTVSENVSLGDRGFFRRFDPAQAAARVRKIGVETGLALDPAARAGDLPVGAQQRLEIVRALARGATTLILDEPTAVLSPEETRQLYAWLRAFVARGHTAVLITHKVREALSVADAVTVLRHGKTVLERPSAGLDASTVLEAMIGTAAHDELRQSRTHRVPGATVLSLHHASVSDERGTVRLRDATLDVHKGEIVGVAGIEGSGQHELLRVLSGRRVPDSGSARIPPQTGFIPEDRLRDALIPAMTLVENFALRDAGRLRGRMRWTAIAERAAHAAQAHGVLASGVDSPASALSGGNQQKFLLSRELEGAPPALVAENPTRGLDFRATARVLAELRAARDNGLALVVYSSDLEEILSLADRMLVCFGGTLTETAVDGESVARALVGLA